MSRGCWVAHEESVSVALGLSSNLSKSPILLCLIDHSSDVVLGERSGVEAGTLFFIESHSIAMYDESIPINN